MHYLVYIFPMLINMMIGGMYFITAYRFAEAGASPILVTGTMAMWALLYSIVSMFAGRFVTEARAAKMVSFSTLIFLIIMVGSVVFPNIYLQYFWMSLLGIAGALYCTAFQVFMKCLEHGATGGIVRSTSLYTAAWSLGLGMGPFIFGVMDWHISYCINAFFSVFIGIGVMFIDRYCRKGCQAEKEIAKEKQPQQEALYKGRPNMVFYGWLGGFLGVFTISILRTLEPVRCVELGISKFHGAMILATVSYTQVLVSLLLIKGRLWMYNKLPLLLSSACGIAGMIGLAFCRCIPLLYLSSFLYGIFSTCFYFRFVFHSLVHPTKSSRYVAMNETLVGLSSVTAPFAGGFLADWYGIVFTFICCAIIIAGTTVVQFVVSKNQR